MELIFITFFSCSTVPGWIKLKIAPVSINDLNELAIFTSMSGRSVSPVLQDNTNFWELSELGLNIGNAGIYTFCLPLTL